jgi:hypothetical protein
MEYFKVYEAEDGTFCYTVPPDYISSTEVVTSENNINRLQFLLERVKNQPFVVGHNQQTIEI